MKFRITVIDVDDVAPGDLDAVVAKLLAAMGQPAPEPRVRPAVLEEEIEAEVTADAAEREVASRQRWLGCRTMCASCVADKPKGLRGPRPTCPKCGSTVWEPKARPQPLPV